MLWNNGKIANSPNTLTGQIDPATLTFAQGTRGTGRQFMTMDPMLKNPLGYSGGDWSPSVNSPVFRANWVVPPDNGFFDQSAKFVGAIGRQDWTEEWTTFALEQDLRP